MSGSARLVDLSGTAESIIDVIIKRTVRFSCFVTDLSGDWFDRPVIVDVPESSLQLSQCITKVTPLPT